MLSFVSLYLLFGKYLDASDNIKITIVFTLKNFKNLQGRDSPYFLINMSLITFSKYFFFLPGKKKIIQQKENGAVKVLCLALSAKSVFCGIARVQEDGTRKVSEEMCV